MANQWIVLYADVVLRQDIPRLGNTIQERIRQAITEKLTTSPERFGKPLRTSLSGYRSLRVGDYRIVFRIEKDEHKVLVFAIVHRAKVYK